MTLVQTEPKKICMWGEPPTPIVEYDQWEWTIVVQRRDIFTWTITESWTYTFQAALKSTSNWTSHLILYVNWNETVHFMKAGADGFLGFSKDVDLSSWDSVRIYWYHDLSWEVAYVAGTKLFKAELEPISSGISWTVRTGSSLYAVYNLSNPTPWVYRWNVWSRSNSNGINLYKSINGWAGEFIARMTDWSYVDVQVSEGTTSLSLFYSMGSGSNTNISWGSVTVYPDSSSLVEKEIKRVTIRPNWVERQIRPAASWDMDKWVLSQTSSWLSDIWRWWIFFNQDGTKIFLTQYGNNGRIYECALSTPYDITTINNFNKYISLQYPEDIHFSEDWTKMVILKNDASPYQIKRYTLSTARDISTATNDQNISRNQGWDRGLYITPDGKNIYVGTAWSTHQVEKYILSTAWDLTTAWTSTVVSSTLWWIWIWFGNNWKMLFKQNEWESDLSYYNLSTPYDLSTATLGWTKNVWTNRAWGIWFNNNWTMCTIVWWGTGTNYITKYTL